MMTDYAKGWLLFLAAIGMMCTLMSAEIAQLTDWIEASKPTFVGKLLAHLGVVIAAFVGGRLIPKKDE